jgi:hypothetical protein
VSLDRVLLHALNYKQQSDNLELAGGYGTLMLLLARQIGKGTLGPVHWSADPVPK